MAEPKQRTLGVTRRRVWQALSIGGATSALGGTPERTIPSRTPVSVRVASLADVSSTPLDFEYPEGHTAFVVKLGRPARRGVGQNQDIVAFHRACPHRGCQISSVDVGRGELGPCPCHLSTFDLTCMGTQVFGMASQNVVQVLLDLRADDEIYAIGLVGLPYGEAVRAL